MFMTMLANGIVYGSLRVEKHLPFRLARAEIFLFCF